MGRLRQSILLALALQCLQSSGAAKLSLRRGARGALAASRAVSRCSVRQHAVADVSSLVNFPSDEAASGCGVALDAAPRGFSFVQLSKATKKKRRLLRPDGQMVAWVSGFPRSSTSTVLSMLSAAEEAGAEVSLEAQDASHHPRTFSLFEPCHDGDKYSKQLQQRGCQAVLKSIADCDFSGVENLWGWPDPHSSSAGHKQYSATVATSRCEDAGLIAFKTVDESHRLADMQDLMNSTPGLRVIDIVRDPRGVYASWKSLEPFATLVKEGNFYSLAEVCEVYAANIDFDSPRVHRVVFEKMLADPVGTMLEIYNFLGLPLDDAPKAWIQQTFDAAECPKPKSWEIGYTDCHTNSTAMAAKWRTVLSREDLDLVERSPACQKVIKHYGYPLA